MPNAVLDHSLVVAVSAKMALMLASVPRGLVEAQATSAAESCLAGIESAWHLDKVVVHNSATSQTLTFKCKAWLDATSGDGRIERNFHPLVECSYRIELQTSDLRGAGTSANGVISLIGSLAEAGPFQMVNDGQTFQRGRLDVITLDGLPDIGAIQQVMPLRCTCSLARHWRRTSWSSAHNTGGSATCFSS